jgi:hypothetical protein
MDICIILKISKQKERNDHGCSYSPSSHHKANYSRARNFESDFFSLSNKRKNRKIRVRTKTNSMLIVLRIGQRLNLLELKILCCRSSLYYMTFCSRDHRNKKCTMWIRMSRKKLHDRFRKVHDRLHKYGAVRRIKKL